MWKKVSRKFEPNTEASKTRLRKKFAKFKLYDITRNPEEWVTELDLLRGDLQKLYVHIDNSEIMTHILSNLPEEYQTAVEILEEKLYYKDDSLTIEKIREKNSVGFDSMN